jgi:hypothetical protein
MECKESLDSHEDQARGEGVLELKSFGMTKIEYKTFIIMKYRAMRCGK